MRLKIVCVLPFTGRLFNIAGRELQSSKSDRLQIGIAGPVNFIHACFDVKKQPMIREFYIYISFMINLERINYTLNEYNYIFRQVIVIKTISSSFTIRITNISVTDPQRYTRQVKIKYILHVHRTI